jgi:hypothetical protein
MINNAFSLMFKDAYGYSSVDPAQFGTMYSNLNTTTHNLLVRGSTSGTSSADVITISQSGSTLTVSVDIGLEVAGVGALPDASNLPAFVSTYDVSDVTSITVQGLSGNDTININNIGAGVPITVSGGNSSDTINIGNGDFTANILSPITVNGDASIDKLNILDSSSIGDDAYNLGATTFSKPGSQILTYGTFESLVLDANDGNNAINVAGTLSTTAVTINGHGGNDTITVGNNNYASNILSAVTANGDAGTDKLIISDGNSPGSDTYTLTSSSFSKTGSQNLTYGFSFEGVTLLANDADDVINVNSTAANTPVTVDAGNGTDTLSVTNTGASAPVIVVATSGLDNVNVTSGNVLFTTSAQLGSLTAGAGGLVTIESSGSNVLSTQNLSLTGDGAVDLTDNGLVIDYTGSSPLGDVLTGGTIAGYVASGYNAGTWDGAGIRSSTAAATPDTAVGYGEAGDVYTTFPNTFMSQGIDQTSVLLRFTRVGDADLNQSVDTIDFNILGSHFAASPSSFTQGDFNYDGSVDTVDFTLLAANFGGLLAAPASKPAGGKVFSSSLIGSLTDNDANDTLPA